MQELILTSMDATKLINSETYTTQTYNLLRAAILRRDLKEGEVYSQDQVSAMLNISRTPVREALLALQKEGYVNFLRGRGFEIIPYDEKDVEDISEVRLIVEKAAAGLATKRATQEQIEALEQNLIAQKHCISSEENFDIQKYLRLDEIFHQQILEASANNRLHKITEDMRNQWMRTAYSILQYSEYRADIFNEHFMILEAIKERDSEKAEQVMAGHMIATQNRRIVKQEEQ